MTEFYFRSETPDTKVYASGGELVKWDSIDGLVGYFKTTKPSTAKALRLLMERGQGGKITEVEKAEYEDFVGKARGRSLFRADREYISQGNIHTQRVPGAESAVVADTGLPAPVAQPEVPVAKPVAAEPAEPVVRRRGRLPKADQE